jgi:voltage-gated potassium channel
MFFIADGEVQVDLPKGRITLTAGEFFGELALLKRVRRSGTVTAVTRTHMMIIDALDFERLLARDEDLKARLLEIADERLNGDWADAPGEIVEEELQDMLPAQRPMGDPVL